MAAFNKTLCFAAVLVALVAAAHALPSPQGPAAQAPAQIQVKEGTKSDLKAENSYGLGYAYGGYGGPWGYGGYPYSYGYGSPYGYAYSYPYSYGGLYGYPFYG